MALASFLPGNSIIQRGSRLGKLGTKDKEVGKVLEFIMKRVRVGCVVLETSYIPSVKVDYMSLAH